MTTPNNPTRAKPHLFWAPRLGKWVAEARVGTNWIYVSQSTPRKALFYLKNVGARCTNFRPSESFSHAALKEGK